MPIPPNLDFVDRIAPYKSERRGKGHYVRCKRVGHKKFLQFVPGAKGDAAAVLNAHDMRYHNPFVQMPGLEPAVRIADLAAEFNAHIEKLEVQKLRSPDTTRHYALMSDYVIRGFRAIGVTSVHELTPAAISDFIRWMRRHSDTEGATIGKALTALKTMIRWRGGRADWRIPHDEIRAEKRPKRDLDVDTIRRLIAAMLEGSVEEAIAYLKARTGCRDVEVLDARREDFFLDAAIFWPKLRSKRKQKRRVYVLTADVIAKVRPFVERAARPDSFVFVDEQARHLTRELLRPRIMAASKRAGFVKKKRDKRVNSDGVKFYESTVGAIDSIAPIRAEVATLLSEDVSIEAAQDQLAHESSSTTERHYVKPRLRIESTRLIALRASAEAVAKAIPLR
jgi:integrase